MLVYDCAESSDVNDPVDAGASSELTKYVLGTPSTVVTTAIQVTPPLTVSCAWARLRMVSVRMSGVRILIMFFVLV